MFRMYIKVKTTPGAKKESFIEEKENVFRVSVKEKAERNQANKKVIELVARHFKVPTGKVRITNGHHHPIKLIYINIEK